MGITEITLYNLIRKRMGEQETYELVEFIHAEVRAELNSKTNVFLTKDDKVDLIEQAKADKIDLVQRMQSDKIDLIERMKTDKIELIERMKTDKIELIERINVSKIDLIDRINKVRDELSKVKGELIVWIVGAGIIQYILLMITKKFF